MDFGDGEISDIHVMEDGGCMCANVLCKHKHWNPYSGPVADKSKNQLIDEWAIVWAFKFFNLGVNIK